MINSATVEHYVNTIWCVAASQYVHEFMIGYTSRSGAERRREYRNAHEYQYLIVIADQLTQPDAMNLEKRLQEAIKVDGRAVLYRKYCPWRREQRYFPSHGPSHAEPFSKTHSVYMAWWEDVS
jgi:hypothetical protein